MRPVLDFAAHRLLEAPLVVLAVILVTAPGFILGMVVQELARAVFDFP